MNRSLDIWQCMDIKCLRVRTDEKWLNVMMKVRLSWPRHQVVLVLSLDVWPIFGKINAQLDIGTPTTEDSNHNIKSRSSWVGMISGQASCHREQYKHRHYLLWFKEKNSPRKCHPTNSTCFIRSTGNIFHTTLLFKYLFIPLQRIQF